MTCIPPERGEEINIPGEVATIVEKTARSDENIFCSDIRTHHILAVVKYSLIPAEKLNADRSFIEIAVLLHDYASIKDSNPCRDHQVDGAVVVDRILSEMGFPKKRLNRSEIAFDRTGAV